MAGKAEARIIPASETAITEGTSGSQGTSRVSGRMPRIDHRITRRRPIRSPIGPPMMVPAATEARKMNRHIAPGRRSGQTARSGRRCSSWRARPNRRTWTSSAGSAGPCRGAPVAAGRGHRRGARLLRACAAGGAGTATYQRPTPQRSAIPQAPRRRTIRSKAGRAASPRRPPPSGPMADPALPPTWNTDWAKAGAHPGGKAGDPRGLGVEDRRAEADESDGTEGRCQSFRHGPAAPARPGRGHAGGHAHRAAAGGRYTGRPAVAGPRPCPGRRR
jgi:hypothetical protein